MPLFFFKGGMGTIKNIIIYLKGNHMDFNGYPWTQMTLLWTQYGLY